MGDTFSRPPFGVGRVEVFLLLATGSTQYFLAVDGVPISFWHDECTDADLNKFGLKRGDCRGQAVWEALAFLGVIRSSALGFGHTPRRRWGLSRKSVQNPLWKISLDMALATWAPRLFYGHVAGKENVWADALSRITEPDVDVCLPEHLRLLP